MWGGEGVTFHKCLQYEKPSLYSHLFESTNRKTRPIYPLQLSAILKADLVGSLTVSLLKLTLI